MFTAATLTVTVIIATLFILGGLAIAASSIFMDLLDDGDLLGASVVASGIAMPALLVYSTGFATVACVVAVFTAAFIVNEMSLVVSKASLSPSDDA